MCKGRSPYACAVRNRASVAHQVIAVVTLRAFNGASASPTGITGPSYAQEVRDQGFDIVHGAVLHRRSCQGDPIYRDPRHILHALFDDAQALPHLFDTHHGAIVAIAA